jgi:hypothetical protein
MLRNPLQRMPDMIQRETDRKLAEPDRNRNEPTMQLRGSNYRPAIS